MTNLSLYLTESADMYPSAAALGCEGVTTTYSELADQAARFAAYVYEHDVRSGDRVGIMVGNRPEFAAAFYGVLHAGAVVVPLDPLRSAREVQLALMNTGARLLFCAPNCAPAATAAALAAGASPIELDYDRLDNLIGDFAGRPRPVSRADDDDAVILHAFGGTGAPKGVQLTHGNLVSTQAVVARTVLDLGPEDVVLGCLPLCHAFGLTCELMAAVCTGSTLDLLPSFDPQRVLEQWPQNMSACCRPSQRCTPQSSERAMTAVWMSARCVSVSPAARLCPGTPVADMRSDPAASYWRDTADRIRHRRRASTNPASHARWDRSARR
jgi:long-chain acyl-CoA synthetase